MSIQKEFEKRLKTSIKLEIRMFINAMAACPEEYFEIPPDTISQKRFVELAKESMQEIVAPHK